MCLAFPAGVQTAGTEVLETDLGYRYLDPQLMSIEHRVPRNKTGYSSCASMVQVHKDTVSRQDTPRTYVLSPRNWPMASSFFGMHTIQTPQTQCSFTFSKNEINV